MADNIDIVRGAYAAFGRGDIGAIIEVLDDSVRWSSPATLPQGGDFAGKAGVTQFFQGVGAAWKALEIEVESVGAIEDRLVVGVVRGSGSLQNGEQAQYGGMHAFTIDNGKITTFRELVDLDRAITP